MGNALVCIWFDFAIDSNVKSFDFGSPASSSNFFMKSLWFIMFKDNLPIKFQNEINSYMYLDLNPFVFFTTYINTLITREFIAKFTGNQQLP